jgi:hypothetical protein
MTSTEDAAAFVARFARVWSDFNVADYLELYAEDGVIEHAGGRVDHAGIAEYKRRQRTALPDAVIHVVDWAARGDTVLIEWRMEVTLNGRRVELPGVDRFHLRGGLALTGRAYFDSSALRG